MTRHAEMPNQLDNRGTTLTKNGSTNMLECRTSIEMGGVGVLDAARGGIPTSRNLDKCNQQYSLCMSRPGGFARMLASPEPVEFIRGNMGAVFRTPNFEKRDDMEVLDLAVWTGWYSLGTLALEQRSFLKMTKEGRA
jgi:hypothetical protein|mmetsp:Transcript_66326/g.110822  ORF Transcript_66326/g.110822 Transcript_66326/m.110822 type:complete len:137 (-) Transcript_66326:1221-1631(-)